jgi:thiamine kinase-like enzyme
MTSDSDPMTADSAVPAAVDAVLRSVPELGDGPFHISGLPGGLTNQNYKVVAASGQRMVLRLSAPQSELLAIDRDAEYANSLAAAAAGVAPRVLAYRPDLRALVIEWIDARTLATADLDDAATLRRVAAACRQLHDGPRFRSDFDMVGLQQRYLHLVISRGYRLPMTYLDLLPRVAAIGNALALRPLPTVPCHNDLLAANIMDDGERIWFIDFEYSGNADPCFELGDLWSETGLPPNRLEELVAAYFGQQSKAMIARARLYGLLANYGWTLWASIQASASPMDFDFWSWGMQKYERAVAEFDDPELEERLAVAGRAE